MYSLRIALLFPSTTSKSEIDANLNIPDIELTYESTTKGKYFLITTNTDYKKATIEAKDILKYAYSNRTSTDIQ